MRISRFVLLAFVLLPSAYALSAPAESFVGRWQGKLKVSVEMRMVVRVEQREPGRLSCVVNFIERQPEPYACGSVTAEGDRINFSVANLGRVEAAIAEGGAILAGTFSFPDGRKQPLQLARTLDTEAWALDPGSHNQSFVTASDGTKLEVLDFGGRGTALVLVAGLGTTGHSFDDFAPKLTSTHRVLAVTRRGFGESDRPPPSADAYSSRRLGDDLLNVMDALRIERAVLVGWSVGGIELSSVASRFPDRVAGLVYLDAAYAYSFYAPGNEQDTPINVDIAFNYLRDRIAAARVLPPAEAAKAMDDILRVALPDLAYDIARNRDRLLEVAAMPAPAAPAVPNADTATSAILKNVERFPAIKTPILAIYADVAPPPSSSERTTAMFDHVARQKVGIITRFKSAHPHAQVVVLKNAQHAVFMSNTEEVLKHVRAFLSTLTQ